MTLDIPGEESSPVDSAGNQLEKAKDLVYLGARKAAIERDLSVKKTWAACH